MGNYIGCGARRFPPRDPRASPMFASKTKLLALPPTLFVVGDYELGLGDSIEMRDRMVSAGHSDVSISVYDRCSIVMCFTPKVKRPCSLYVRLPAVCKRWLRGSSSVAESSDSEVCVHGGSRSYSIDCT